MKLKKMTPIYLYDEEKELIKKAIRVLNSKREKGDGKAMMSNFARNLMLEEAKRVLKDIEKGK